jgi:hypothetical protein
MKRIVADETLLETVAAAGHRQAGNYSLPGVADQFLSDFKSLVGNADV